MTAQTISEALTKISIVLADAYDPRCTREQLAAAIARSLDILDVIKQLPRCARKWRKPADQITDRAARYRAQKCIKPGPKQCEICGSKQNLVIDHRDGFEEHGEPSNLRWLCKRCNTKLGIAFARAGLGRRTRQYNPGAETLAQYVLAVTAHTRGAHDEGGRIIHETPKSKRREFAAEIWARRRARAGEDFVPF